MSRVYLALSLLLCVSCALCVRGETLSILNDSTLPDARVGVEYSVAMRAGGGTPPYTWRFPLGENVPFFLSLASSGTLGGTPRQADVGALTLRLQATDATGATAIKTFTLRVGVAGALAIATEALPGGRLGARYDALLQGTGGTPPYQWAVPAGALPPGLALNPATGEIGGTPLKAGIFTPRITVADAVGGHAIKDFTIVIADSETVFSAGPQAPAGAPVAVGLDAGRSRLFIVQRPSYGDVMYNDELMPTNVVSVIDTKTAEVLTTIPVGRSRQGDGQGIAVDPGRGQVYVTNRDDGTLSIIDAQTMTVAKTVPVGQEPVGVAADTGSGAVYVADFAGHAIVVLDSSGRVAQRIPTAGGAYAVAVDQATRALYALVSASPWTVQVYRNGSLSGETPLTLLLTPKTLAVDPASRVYAADYNSGAVSVIDTRGARPVELLRFAGGGYPGGMAVDETTHEILVSDSANNQVKAFSPAGEKQRSYPALRLPTAMAVDSAGGKAYVVDTASDSFTVIDLRAGLAISHVPLGIVVGGLAFDPGTERLYAANLAADAVSVIDTRTRKVKQSYPAGPQPWAIALDPALGRIFTLNVGDGTVGVLNLVDGTQVASIPIGPVAGGTLTLDPATHLVYASTSSLDSQYVAVMDANTNQLRAKIATGSRPTGTCYDPATRRLLVANQQSGTISLIDTARMEATGAWAPSQNNVWDLAIDAEYRQLYVTIPPARMFGSFAGLAILDADTGETLLELKLGQAPDMALVDPATHLAYMTDSGAGTLTVVDGDTGEVLAVKEAGPWAHAMALDPKTGTVYVGITGQGAIFAATRDALGLR